MSAAAAVQDVKAKPVTYALIHIYNLYSDTLTMRPFVNSLEAAKADLKAYPNVDCKSGEEVDENLLVGPSKTGWVFAPNGKPSTVAVRLDISAQEVDKWMKPRIADECFMFCSGWLPVLVHGSYVLQRAVFDAVRAVLADCGYEWNHQESMMSSLVSWEERVKAVKALMAENSKAKQVANSS